MSRATLHIEVVYASPRAERIYPLAIEPGATLADAIRASGVLADCAEIDLSVNRVGIWGRLRALGDRLHDGDRVEIYRGLRADPKDARRRRGATSRGKAR